MEKVDLKILSEIHRKIDALSRGFSNNETKTLLHNFMMLFIDKIKEDKSPVHIDSLVEAFRQYTVTQDVERRFTTLIFMHAFLQQLAGAGKVTYHRFLDGVERNLAPEILNAYIDYNKELLSGLDFENQRFKFNVCAMSMLLIQRILILCATKFCFDRQKQVRGFEQMLNGMQAGTRTEEIMASHAAIDFRFFDNDTNYLAEGPRVSQNDLPKNVVSMSPVDMQAPSFKYVNQSGLRPEGLRAEVAKLQRIRGQIRGCLKIPQTEADIDAFDTHLEQYKQACLDYVERMKVSPGVRDEEIKKEGKKELDFSRFLLVDLVKIMERNPSDVNLTIREILKEYNRIFGTEERPSRSGIETELSFRPSNKETNPFSADLNLFQNKEPQPKNIRGKIEPISDFDKFEETPFVVPGAFAQASNSQRPTPAFGSQTFENFAGPEVQQKEFLSPIMPPNEFKKPKHFSNLFAEEEEEDPFQKEAKFEDFQDAEDVNRVDNFIKKVATPYGFPNTTNKQNFGDAFGGVRAEDLDQPVRDSQRGISPFDDFGNVSANRSGFGPGWKASMGSQGFGKPSVSIQGPGKQRDSLPASSGIKRSTFEALFDGPGAIEGLERHSMMSHNATGMSLGRSQLNQRSQMASNLMIKGQKADPKNSQLGSSQLPAQVTFGQKPANLTSLQNNSTHMRDSGYSETRENLHNALNRVSNLTSGQTSARERQSNYQERTSVTPPRVEMTGVPGSSINQANLGAFNTSQGPSQNTPSRSPGFSLLNQNNPQRLGGVSISFAQPQHSQPTPNMQSDTRNSQFNDPQLQSGVKRPAPFAATYEDTPAIGKRPMALMGHTRPSRTDSEIKRTSNFTVGFPATPVSPVVDYQAAVKPQPVPQPVQVSMENVIAFNLEDFGSVKSDSNRLVDSIVESHSNNLGSCGADNLYDLRANPKQQGLSPPRRPGKPTSKTPSGRNLAVTVLPNPITNPPPGFTQSNVKEVKEPVSPLQKRATDLIVPSNDPLRPKKVLGPAAIDQRSIHSARQNPPSVPAHLEPENMTISDDPKRPETSIPSVGVSRSKQPGFDTDRPSPNPPIVHLSIAELGFDTTPPPEYSHIILQYEQMIAQYRREITELKATEAEGRNKLEELNTTIVNLRNDNVSLNTKLTSLKIDVENQDTKHRNQMLKLKDDFKKNNEAKLVAIERSYSENLSKTRSDYDQQILSLQQEISSLTMERRMLAEDKGQIRMEKAAQFMELSGYVEQLKQMAGSIQLDLRVAKDKLLNDLAEKKTALRSGGGGSQPAIYNQLLAEKKKNVELTKQVLKMTNEALTNAANHQYSADKATVDVNALGLDRLKRQIADAKTSNHRIGLAVMATLAKWHMDFSKILKTKIAGQSHRFLELENARRAVEQENTNLRFQNEIVTSQMQLAQTGLKIATEELQTVKKELIEAKFLHGNAPRGDADIEMLRKLKRMEQENKQLVDYTKQIQDELLATQERALEREGDSVPLKTHMTLLKRAESERDELALTNQNLLVELRGLIEGREREQVAAKKASQASGVKKSPNKGVIGIEVSDEVLVQPAPRAVVRSANAIPSHQAPGNRIERSQIGTLNPSMPSTPTKLTVGSALIQKTMDVVKDIHHYDAPNPSFGFLINAIATSSPDDLRLAALNCTQNRYKLLKTSDLQVAVQEDIVFAKNCPEVTLQVTFRNKRDALVRFLDVHMETESYQVQIEAQEDPSLIKVPAGQTKSVWFVITFQSGYFLDCKPIWLLFKSSLELGTGSRPGNNSKVPLDSFHRFVLPLSVNKLLETPVERIEKFSVLKTLKTVANITLPMAGTLRHERLAAVFPSVCSLNDEEGIFGVKMASPQGMFFVTFLSRERDTITVLISSMFELKVFEELRETLEFIFRYSFI